MSLVFFGSDGNSLRQSGYGWYAKMRWMDVSATRIQTVLLDADGVMQAPVRKLVPELEGLCEHPRDAKNFTADIFAAEKPCLIGEADFAAVLEGVIKRWRVSRPLFDELFFSSQLGALKPDQRFFHGIIDR